MIKLQSVNREIRSESGTEQRKRERGGHRVVVIYVYLTRRIWPTSDTTNLGYTTNVSGRSPKLRCNDFSIFRMAALRHLT